MDTARIALGAFLLLAPVSLASAEPVTRPGGGSCDSTKTGVTVGGTQDGKAVTCTADACYWTEFLDNPPRHVNHTSYSNVRDCHPAAAKAGKPTYPILKHLPMQQVQ